MFIKLNKHSIIKRLIIYIVLITALFMVGIGTVTYYWGQNMVIHLSKLRASSMADAAATKIDSYLLQKGQYAWTMAQDEQIHNFAESVELRNQDFSQDNNYHAVMTTCRRIVNKDSNIYQAYIAVEKTQSLYDLTGFNNPPGYKVGQRPWYQAAVNAKGLAFTAPYLCPVNHKMVITATVPFYNNDGQLLGVAGVDILVGTLQSIVSGVDLFQTGYGLLIDNKGVIIAHPNSENYMKNLEELDRTKLNLQKVARKTVNGDNVINVVVNGIKKYVFYAPISGVDWFLAVVVPVNEVTDPMEVWRVFIAITTIVGLLSISIIIGILTSRITKPINEFTTLMNKVENGDYNIRAKVESNDEVGMLGHSLNSLLDKQQKLIEQIVNTAFNMGVSGHELAITISEATARLSAITSNMGNVTENSIEIPYNELFPVFKSQIIENSIAKVKLLKYLNSLQQNTTPKVDTLMSNLENYFLNVEQASLLNELNEIWYTIKQQLMDEAEAIDSTEMNLEDVNDFLKKIKQYMAEDVNKLTVLNKQIDGIISIQSDSLERARLTSLSLVKWSQSLLQLSADFNVGPLPPDMPATMEVN